MAKKIPDWPLLAVDMNFDVLDGGQPEGMLRSDVNNSGRVRMEALRDFYDDKVEFLDLMRNPDTGDAFVVSRLTTSSVRIASGANDMSSFFNVGRRIRTLTASAVTDQLFVLSVVYSNPNTDVTMTTAGVTAGIDGIEVHSSATLGTLAFEDDVENNFVIPATNDAAGIQAAYDSLAPRGGTILLLRVEYALETNLLFDDHSVLMWGQGRGATVLKVNNATNLANAIELSGAGGGAHFVMRDFTLDGNRANQTSGTGDGILIAANADDIWLDGLEILSTRGSGTFLSGAGVAAIENPRIWHSVIDDTGFHCIGSDDSNDVNSGATVSDCQLSNPGQETGLHTTSSGVYITGKRWALSNVIVSSLDLGGSFTQTGVTFAERLAADPNPQDGRFGVLSGFSIEGTGVNAVGVGLHGEHNSVSAGSINLSGSTSRGIVFNGAGGSRTPRYNTLTGITIANANVGILMAEAADLNTISNCILFGCTKGLVIQGSDKNTINAVKVDANNVASTTGFGIEANSQGNMLTNCSAYNIVGTAIEVSGGDENRISDFLMDTVDQGIELQSGSTNTDIDGVRSLDMDPAGNVIESLTGVTGTRIKNVSVDGTENATLVDADDETILWHSVEGVTFDTEASEDVSVLGGAVRQLLSSQPLTPTPNGARKYRVTFNAMVYVLNHTLTSGFFRLGPTGTGTGDTAFNGQPFFSGSGTGFLSSGSYVTGAVTTGDTLSASMTVQAGGGSTSFETFVTVEHIEGT